MRLLLLPLVISFSAPPGFPQAPGARAEPPRPLVVLVHGRGQFGSDTAALRAEWKRELNAALATQRLPALQDEEVALAWYADVLDPAVSPACERQPYAIASGSDMVRSFLVSLASVIPDSTPASDRSARALLGDVLYVVDPVARCAAETRLGDVVARAGAGGRPVIIVAYSLGAFVAFEYLRRLPADSARAVHFITLGSPLGVPLVRELLLGGGAPLSVPAAVASWTNVYDPGDGFSGPLDLSDRRVVDRPFENRVTHDPHWVNGYLRAAATGSALAAALCASRPSRACEAR